MASIISTMLAGCGAASGSPDGECASRVRLVSALASQSPRAALMRAGGCGR